MFTKDSRTENLLTQFGVAWRYSNAVSFAQLAPNWQRANFGRSAPRVQAAVEEYAARMESGSPAPAPILNETNPLGLEVLDGVQRLLAAEQRGSTEFSGYIIETDSPKLARKIRVLANHLLAGHPENEEWTLAHAVQLLIIEDGMTPQELHDATKWSIRQIENEQKVIETGFRIRCAGGPEQLPKGILLNVEKHAKAEDITAGNKPVIEFLGDLKRGRFGNGESEPMIADFFDVRRGDAKKMYPQFEKRLKSFRELPEVSARLEGRKRSSLAPDVKLLATLRSALTVANEVLANHESVPYLEEHFHIWNQVRDALTAIGKKKVKAK